MEITSGPPTTLFFRSFSLVGFLVLVMPKPTPELFPHQQIPHINHIDYLYIIYEEETFEKILSAQPSSRGLGWVLARDAPRPVPGARPGARLESPRF